jgi:hypothetical protein
MLSRASPGVTEPKNYHIAVEQSQPNKNGSFFFQTQQQLETGKYNQQNIILRET